jgi:hypothetical protein
LKKRKEKKTVLLQDLKGAPSDPREKELELGHEGLPTNLGEDQDQTFEIKKVILFVGDRWNQKKEKKTTKTTKNTSNEHVGTHDSAEKRHIPTILKQQKKCLGNNVNISFLMMKFCIFPLP